MSVSGELNQMLTTFNAKLTQLKSINKSTLPSNYTAVITNDEQTQVIPAPGEIKLDGVVAEYTRLVNEQVLPKIDNMKAIKIEVYGNVVTIAQYKSILAPDLSGLPTLNVDKISELEQKAKNLREQARAKGQLERQSYADLLRNQYNEFSRLYGKDYKHVYRKGGNTGIIGKIGGWIFGSDEDQTQVGNGDARAVPGVVINNDMDQRDIAFKRLIDVFWTRSYLRLVKGIQLCALQPKEVQTTNFTAFQAIDALKELRAQPACNSVDLNTALEYSRRILISSGAQSEHVFDNKNGFMNAGLLNKLGSAVTFTLGKRPAAEALNMLMQLVYADIQEEIMLATPGQGLRALRELYSARYQSTQEQKTYYTGIKCAYDIDAAGCGERGAFDEVVSAGAEDDDIRAIFLDMKNAVTASRAYLDQAQSLSNIIRSASLNPDAIKKEDARSNEL